MSRSEATVFAATAMLVAVAANLHGCGNSTGGAPQSAAAGSTNTVVATDTGLATGLGTGTPIATSTLASGSTSTDKNPPAPGADPTDAQICAFIGSQNAAILQHFTAATAYLCSQGGLAALRGATGKMQTLQNTTDGSGVSHFTLAAALTTKGTPVGAQKLTNLFCTNNAQYQSDVGAAAFKNVTSITTSAVTAESCNFDFKASAFLISPEYLGAQQFVMNSDQSLGLGVSYLTKSISTVTDSTTLSVAAKSGSQVYVYTVLTSASPTFGVASLVYQDLVTGTTASIQGSAQAITNLSQ